MSQDPAYYAARAEEERRLAMASANPQVRRVHLELAAQYALKAGTDGTLEPKMRPPEAKRLFA